MTAADKRLESHWRLLHPSKYMCAADLRGRDLTARIKTVSQDDLPVAGSSEKKTSMVITFHDQPKPLVANVTNLRLIAQVLGPYVMDWIGKPITLFVTKKEANGKAIKDPSTKKVVDAIRVRTRPAGAADEPDTDDNPADEPKEQTA